jgi:purine-binding chemotaxis protein CheW
MTKLVKNQSDIQSNTQTKYNRMPNQKQDRKRLRKRAINLASKLQPDNQENTEIFLHVHLDNNEHYGIPYKYLDEICRPRAITSIPSAPKIIIGVIPYRGELIAVLDLSQMLNISLHAEDERVKKSWLAIVSVEHMNVALLVNEVCGNYHYQPEKLCHSLHNTTEAENDPVDGIFDGKIAILDLTILLSRYHLKLEKNK